ncbi:MAG: hypothetical protein Q7W44_05525 [Coriobacteriia bacterium]|nr:hypothetical protein [Coriobacteriia bacterium]
MHRTARHIRSSLLVAVLVAALLVPALTFGAQGSGQAGSVDSGSADTGTATAQQSGSTGDSAQAADAAVAQLRARIGLALQKRARRFDTATAALERQRTRLMTLADKLEQLGGDVSQVRTRLRECEQLLVQAREQEQTATRLMRRIADEQDRSGAFVRARTQARAAVQTMSQARTRLRAAADLLEDIAEDIGEGGETG